MIELLVNEWKEEGIYGQIDKRKEKQQYVIVKNDKDNNYVFVEKYNSQLCLMTFPLQNLVQLLVYISFNRYMITLS